MNDPIAKHDADQSGAPGGDRPAPARPVLGWCDAWWPVVALIAGLTALRLVFLIWFSPFSLIEDEAHYWEWSRRLDWSYYSKGPGVAWAIWAATSLLGNAEWAVRLPAVLASAIGSAACAGLARDVFGDRRLMVLAAAAYQSMPGVFVTGLIMTIDGPYLACWALAAWAGWRAIVKGSGPAWVALGLALAAGFIFKYTVLLLPLGMLLFALVRPMHVRVFGEKGPGPGWVVAGVACAIAGVVPIAVWNAGHDWATVRHLLGHLGVAGGDVTPTHTEDGGWSYSPAWTLEFIGLQFAVAGAAFPLVVLAFINKRKAVARGEAQWTPAGPAYLFLIALPIFVFYLGVTLFTRVEANWSIAAYVSLAPAAAWAAIDGVHRHDRPIRFTWNFCLITLALMIVGTPIVGYIVTRDDTPDLLGRFEPIDEFVRNTAEVGERLGAETGLEPAYIAIHYGRASLMAFYLPDHPRTYAASAHFGDGRKTQYDIWDETNLANPGVLDRLQGRPAVLFDGEEKGWLRLFDRVEDLGVLPGEPKEGRKVLVGYGYRGLPEQHE